ncbi:MAG: UDP-N-acetylglucosamine diphosphorylase [Clostridia bacterium]|nr:UDP-N-acetylglucosamine diphosphorylase [Clostridia bacterium]
MLNNEQRIEVIQSLINSGVEIPCFDGVIIEPDVVIGKGTVIMPGTVILGDVVIGTDCVIGPNSYIQNTKIGNNTKLNNTQAFDSVIGNGVSAGPFVHVRPNCKIADNVHIGNFVEVKNSTVDEGSKLPHLLYVGDSDVGKDVNFGCGCVTVNYDGRNKSRTTVKDGAFIGCNTNLVAPVTVGENAFTAAGSTITEDVPDNSLAVARSRQTVKEDWVNVKKPYKRQHTK